MSSLTFIEKKRLESFLEMKSGYLLDFSNQGLEDFVAGSTRLNIYHERFDRASGSKANRMRAFWELEPDHVVGKLISDLVEYHQSMNASPKTAIDYGPIQQIASRLLSSSPVESLSAIGLEADGDDFELLASEVRGAIERNTPQAGLDRLHTYVVKLMRRVALERGIEVADRSPLHAIFGQYARRLRETGEAGSDITKVILKSAGNLLDGFNAVRNKETLAHDNDLVSYSESLLIYNQVCSAVRFIVELERTGRQAAKQSQSHEVVDDIPF